ncbi:MAG: radical SAM protein, partial [Candidatus Atribacteria bacterium]|nr:radical SAM protein [Candidatus Atribacteria bacterium]MCD6350171.1 radical SAM protein [Candidatus Atribacteria bacterium]
ISSTDPVKVLKEIGIVLGKDPQISTVEEFLSVPPLYSLYKKLSYGVILTSVGCPFRCSYCASSALWPSFLRRNPTLVIEEIKTLYYSFGVKDFAFYDDALLFRARESFLQLLKGIIKLDLPLRFHLPNGIHARFLEPEIARMMHRANFKTLRIALETASPEIQRATGNKVDNPTFENAVVSLQKAGFPLREIEVYLLFGLPGLSPEDYFFSAEYVKKMGLRPRIALYSPVPGSKDFEKLIRTYPEINNEPLLHNKIAYLYSSGQNELYTKLQKLCSESL